MPTVRNFIFPGAGKNRPSSMRLYIYQSGHVHSLRRWRELAYHQLTKPDAHRLSPAKLNALLRDYPLHHGTAGDPLRLSPKDFAALLRPAPRMYLPTPADPFLIHPHIPYPRYLGMDPQLRAQTLRTALKTIPMLRILNLIHTAHLSMLRAACEASYNPTAMATVMAPLIQRLEGMCRDSACPRSYITADTAPDCLRYVLMPVLPPTTPLQPLHPTAFP